NDNVANTLNGGAGNDLLMGLGGADTMNGGAGNDRYVITAGDVITDTGGIDTVVTDASYGMGPDIENLEVTGTAAVEIQGNNLANHIVGNDANNFFNGRAGDDHLEGKGGNDV